MYVCMHVHRHTFVYLSNYLYVVLFEQLDWKASSVNVSRDRETPLVSMSLETETLTLGSLVSESRH